MGKQGNTLFAEFKNLSIEELKDKFDSIALTQPSGYPFNSTQVILLEEISRRTTESATARMETMTQSIKKMTAVVVLLTALNTALVLVTLLTSVHLL